MWCIFSRCSFRAEDHWKSSICGLSKCGSCRAKANSLYSLSNDNKTRVLRGVGTLCTWAVDWVLNRIPWAAEAVKLDRQKELCYSCHKTNKSKPHKSIQHLRPGIFEFRYVIYIYQETGYISYDKRYYNILKHYFQSLNICKFKTSAAPRKKIRRAEIRWFRVRVFSSLYYHDFHNCHHFNLYFFPAIRLRQFKFNINFCGLFNGLDDKVINWRKLFLNNFLKST